MTTKVKGVSIDVFDLFGAVSTEDMGPQNTDITTQVNTALAAGRPVFVPIGTWLIKGIILPVGASIIGMGTRSVLKLKDVSNAVAITVSNYASLDNLLIDGNKDNQAGGGYHGVEVAGAINVTIKDVRTINTKGSGFLISGASDGVIINQCQAIGYGDSGFKITRGININLDNCLADAPDVNATGDGIALISDGNAITNVNISEPIVNKAINRGIAITGNGGRSVTDINIISPKIVGCTGHNIHIMSADTVSILGGIIKSSSGDGVRIEADTQNCRINSLSVKNNVGFGIREIINGSTPNYNGYIYNVLAGNSNNAVVKVGLNSFVV